MYDKLLANSDNTKCRHFQVKINYPKYIIDELQKRCHMAFLISLFVTWRNVLFGTFLPKKNLTILPKIAVNLKQLSQKSALLSVSAL